MEKWNTIPERPEYEASSNGRIKSTARKVRFVDEHGTEHWRQTSDKILSTDKKVNNAGYCGVSLGKKVTRFVHQCVWSAFNGPIPNGMTINHINGNKKDNRLNNLELCTHKENNRKAWQTGLCESIRNSAKRRTAGEKNPKNVLTRERAKEIFHRNLVGETQVELAKKFGVSQSAISYLKVTRWFEK